MSTEKYVTFATILSLKIGLDKVTSKCCAEFYAAPPNDALLPNFGVSLLADFDGTDSGLSKHLLLMKMEPRDNAEPILAKLIQSPVRIILDEEGVRFSRYLSVLQKAAVDRKTLALAIEGGPDRFTLLELEIVSRR